MSTPTSFHYPRVLCIAGSDSGGGAGIQADLKTLSALGCYGMTAITALTAQNTVGVQGVFPAGVDAVRRQIDSVVSDIGTDAVKIGMLGDAATVVAVADGLRAHGLQRVVLDPVAVSSTGAALIEPDAVSALVQHLLPLCAVLTPNLDEAALLVQHALPDVQAMRAAARQLQGMGATAVLLKGGHLPGEQVADVLLLADGSEHVFDAPRIATANHHGTGCTLSSAIAAHLALGADLLQAVQAARSYIRNALQAGARVQTGHGIGPLNHGFAPLPMQVLPHR